MEKFLDLGVDGIITDRPDILNEVMEERAHAAE
jgi:glycerophosphoryl diester phosphodiesterase